MGDSDSFLSRFVLPKEAGRYSDRYNTGRRARTHRREATILEEVVRNVGGVSVALDIPCGAGRMSPILGRFCKRVIAADASDEMLKVARERLSGFPAQYLKTRAESIDLPNGSVDLVFSHRFLHHIQDPASRARILAEFVRVSRRYVLIPYYSRGLRTRVRHLIRKTWNANARGTRLATLPDFVREATAAGLTLAKERIMRRFPGKAVFCLFNVTSEDDDD